MCSLITNECSHTSPCTQGRHTNTLTIHTATHKRTLLYFLSIPSLPHKPWKTNIYKIPLACTSTHVPKRTPTHIHSLFHNRSHQIKAKGSGSRPRLALDSLGRRGGAVWAEVPKLSGLQNLQQLNRPGNQKKTGAEPAQTCMWCKVHVPASRKKWPLINICLQSRVAHTHIRRNPFSVEIQGAI